MKRLTICVVALGVLFGVTQLKAEIVIDYDTTIDYSINELVRIIEGVDPPTTVEIVEPAYIDGYVDIYQSSIVNISGGTIDDPTGVESRYMRAYDSSIVNVSGGRLFGLKAYHNSLVNVTDGYFDSGDISVRDSATINFFGGLTEALGTNDFSTLNVFGGVVEKISSEDSSTVNVFGGTIREFDLGEGAPASTLVTIRGSGFNYDYGPIPDAAGTLTGTLANGDSIDATFVISSGSSIVLAPIPEPSTIILLMTGAFGLLGYRIRRR